MLPNNLQIFLSNRLEILYAHLKNSLFSPSIPPLMRRLIVVYGPAMKTWLSLKMAQDPELQVAFGIEYLYLNQAFESLSKHSLKSSDDHFPTPLELAIAIEKEFMYVLKHFPSLPLEEQQDWEDVIQYLKLQPCQLGLHLSLTRKMERRLIELSQHLAQLFQEYGRYAYPMVSQWDQSPLGGWQARLWHRLFNEDMKWTYLSRVLQNFEPSCSPFTLHFFSISFMTVKEFHFIKQLSKSVRVNYYLLSPCAVFWSDIRSDKESVSLQSYWQKKFAMPFSKLLELEEFLTDRNPLLANFGRIGREMAYQIEASQSVTQSNYLLPDHVCALDEELFFHEDLSFSDSLTPLTLLHALQADLLMMRNPQGQSHFNLEDSSDSLQLHIAPNSRREIQILYNTLLSLISKDPSLCAGDIIVMAPKISEYVPYIQSVFGESNSQLDFQILDLGMQTQNRIVQGFLQLLELGESSWDASQILQLFGHSSFQLRHQITQIDYATIRSWIIQSGIRWGDDESHRNEVLKRRHCLNGMVEETAVGTWDYGLTRLLLSMTMLVDEQSSSGLDIPLCSNIDFSQGELLEKWILLFHSLRDDLSPLHDRTQMTLSDWGNYLNCLLDSYFQPDFESPHSIQEFEKLKSQFEVLRRSSRYFKEATFPFMSVKTHLLSLLSHGGITYREDHLQAVRFCSLVPLRSIPAKVIAIIGLQEESFPRSTHHSSLNLMRQHEQCDYSPLSVDYDRYLFLEALHSAQEYLFLSYQGYHPKDSRELRPSLVVEELFSYLDKYYTLHGKSISEKCIFKHPFDSFDKKYFTHQIGLKNHSKDDFNASLVQNKVEKMTPHRFLKNFSPVDHPLSSVVPNQSQIELKHLLAATRNPIKFYLNRVLGIYLQTEEDRKLQVEEEIVLSSLDRYRLKQLSLKNPMEKVLQRAEKEGILPFGLFKIVAVNHFKEEFIDIIACFKRLCIQQEQIFELEFSAGCTTSIQIEHDRWMVPAPSLTYEDGYQISIVGKISLATSKGLLSIGKGSLSDIWKIWPEFLMFCHAARYLNFPIEKNLIFTLSEETKHAFFADTDDYLKHFVNYYSLCLQNFSPLMPDWISLILDENEMRLNEKMQQLYSEVSKVYQSPDVKWILNKNSLPDAKEIIYQWKPRVGLLMSEVLKHWITKRERATVSS